MKKTFYSHGKLLITGEYLVLDGAKALALPTRFGQSLTVEKGNTKEIKWTSFDADGSIWFEDSIPFSAIETHIKKDFSSDEMKKWVPDNQNLNTFSEEKKAAPDSQSVKATLRTILHEAYLMNPRFLTRSEGYTVTTHLTFPRKWGLGTSSTLLNNIAQWIDINAFTLLKNSFGGSGYDIACAQNDSPILYQLEQGRPIIEKVVFEPVCAENIYFVYLNQKQDSKTAIARYNKNKSNVITHKNAINAITEAVVQTNDFHTLADLLEKHEAILSVLLGTQTVKEMVFPDFNGTIKSLGAWGGDFIVALSKENPESYFISKGYTIVIPYRQMILRS